MPLEKQKKIKSFLRLFENSWTDWWQKKTDLENFLKKMLSIQFPFMEFLRLAFFYVDTKVFSSESLPQNYFFLFFFQPQIEFCTQTNIFRKFFFMQNVIFLCA